VTGGRGGKEELGLGAKRVLFNVIFDQMGERKKESSAFAQSGKESVFGANILKSTERKKGGRGRPGTTAESVKSIEKKQGGSSKIERKKRGKKKGGTTSNRGRMSVIL